MLTQFVTEQTDERSPLPRTGVLYRCPSGRHCTWVPHDDASDHIYWTFRYASASSGERARDSGFCFSYANLRLLRAT